MSPYDPNIHHRRSIRLKGYDYASVGLYFVTICTQNRECLFGEIKNDEMVLNDAGRMVEKWYRKTHDKFPDIICHEMVIMPNHFHCIWENVGLHGASPVGADPCVRPLSNDVQPNPCVRPFSNDVQPNPCVRRPKQNMEPSTNIVIDDCDREKGVHTGNGEHNIMMGVHVGNGKHDFMEGAHVGNDKNDVMKGAHVGNDKNDVMKGAHVGAPLQTDLGEHTGSPLSSVVQWFKTMSTNEYIRGVKQLGWPPFDRKLWQRNYYEHIIRDDVSLQNIAFYIENNPAQWQDDDFFPKN